jgi:DNA-binding Lrp family transcriptional regulator
MTSKDKKKSIITQKDILILRELLENGRESSSSISKKIDLGREIVNYRIKRLIKENLIIKFIPKINTNALHYQEYIILLKLNLEDKISKEKFVKDRIGNKYLLWFIKSNTGWDLLVRLYAQGVEEFKEKLSEILEIFADVLTDYYTIITSEKIKEDEKKILVNKLFNEKINNKDYENIKKFDIKKDNFFLDEKDKTIIKMLENDARIQYKEIAQELNISSDTVKYRINKMISFGIIEGFMPVINLSKLDLFQYVAIVKFKFLNKEEENKVKNFILENKNIIRAIKSLNNEEYFLNLVFKEESETILFKEKLNNLIKNKIEFVEIFMLK